MSPVVGSPSVASDSTYSGVPGTCCTEVPSIAAMASCLLPRWASPKFVNAVDMV